jgi:iron complex outermembrane receptor protein
VQDEWSPGSRRARLSLGTKLEHNDYTGLEIQPSLRLAWAASENRTLWGAVSRAVRTPSRLDRDVYTPADPPYLLAGGPGFDSEVLWAFELGHRFQQGRNLTASIATFYDRYDRLRSLEGGPPYVLANGLFGHGTGIETDWSWQARSHWRLSGGYTYLQLDLHTRPGSTDMGQVAQEGDSPRHQAFLRSAVDLPHSFTFDVSLRYVSELVHQHVPQYLATDAHVGWQGRRCDLGVYGRNLFDARHAEFGTPASRREVPRSVYGKVSCRF